MHARRAAGLDRIGSVANEVTDAADATHRQYGFPLDDHPPAVAMQEM